MGRRLAGPVRHRRTSGLPHSPLRHGSFGQNAPVLKAIADVVLQIVLDLLAPDLSPDPSKERESRAVRRSRKRLDEARRGREQPSERSRRQ